MCLMVCLSSSSLFAIDDGVFFTVNGLTYEKASSDAAQNANDVKVYMGNYSGAITIPATVTYNGQTCNVVEIGSYCFENCNLTSISIGSKVRYINDCAFSGCSISNGITIPSNVVTIAYNAFRNTKLSSLTIPSTAKFDMRDWVEFSGTSLVTLNIEVTNLTQLSSLTCSNLKNLSLSSGKLPSSSSFNCPKLETLTLNHSAKLAMTSSEWPSTSYVPAPEKIILYVPSSLVSSYKSDSFWQKFGAITNVGDTTKPLILQASPTSKTLKVGENFTLSCYMAPSGSASVSYSSSNTSVATVTSAGKVTAVASGTATITIKAGSKSATCAVTVSHTHSYGTPTWTWATNGKSASAKFTCTANDDTQTKTATITSAVKTQPTCSTKGTTTYTAKVTFNNTEYTSTKDVQDIPVTGHKYGQPTWTWASDGKSASAKFTCTSCSNIMTKTATITSAVKTAATCSSMGTTTYTAKVTYNSTTYTSTKDVQDIPITAHSYGMNGFCTVCDDYQPAVKGDDGYYQIANAGNLYWFTASDPHSANAKLTKDIVVNSNVLDVQGKPQGTNFRKWIPIGREDHEFKGTFDGNNHTISGLYLVSNDSDDEGISVFGCCENANVKNLTIKDSYFCGMQNVSGIVGLMYGGQVFNCHNYSTAEIKGTMSYLGGIVASCNTAEIRNCSNYGLLISNSSSMGCVGGICGATDTFETSVSIVGCSNFGNIIDNRNTAYSGGIVGDLTSGSEEVGFDLPAIVESCYNVGSIAGKIVGAIACQMSSGCSANYCVAKEGTASSLIGDGELGTQQDNVFLSDFSTGEAAYILNGKTNAGTNWYQNLDNGKTPDAYPVLDTTHGMVYYNEGSGYSNTEHFLITLVDSDDYTQSERMDNVDLSYTRNFKNTGWQSLYVPFAMSYEDWKDDFDVAYIEGFLSRDLDYDGVIDETTWSGVMIKAGTILPNTPYLIRAKSTGEKTISLKNTTLYPAEINTIDCSSTTMRYDFIGIYESESYGSDTENWPYYMNNGAFSRVSKIIPFRWIMRITSRGNSFIKTPDMIRGMVRDDDGTSFIEYVDNHQEQFRGYKVFTLDGRMIDTPEEEPLKPGFYIKNGKKILIR